MTWTYDLAPPKPHVHPVVAPNGRVLTRVSPPDHPWMRGLWFAIKFVDGVNCWEEVADFGVQRQTDEVVEWVGPDGTILLTEQRQVMQWERGIDWTTTLHSSRPLTLDRTPYTTWGGYGGLAFRGAAEWDDTRIELDDGTVTDRPTGQRSRWAYLHGPDAGLLILDHPANVGHPVPWYGGTRSPIYGEGWGNFLNAAFLFDGPRTLSGGLTLRYRVIVDDGTATAAACDASWSGWVER